MRPVSIKFSSYAFFYKPYLLLCIYKLLICLQIIYLAIFNFYLQKIYKKQDYKKACIYRIDFDESEGSQRQKLDRGSSTVVQ